MTTLRQRMLEDMRVRNLSPKTQQIYIGLVARFARHFRKSPELLGPEEVRAFQVHLVGKQLSRSLLIQTVAALRFLYHVTLGKQWPLQGRWGSVLQDCISGAEPFGKFFPGPAQNPIGAHALLEPFNASGQR